MDTAYSELGRDGQHLQGVLGYITCLLTELTGHPVNLPEILNLCHVPALLEEEESAFHGAGPWGKATVSAL